MKSKLTLLFLFIASIAHAQYNSYSDTPMFGMGVGYNLVSMVGDDARPVEVSFRFRINSNNMLQLYMPFLKQSDSFGSKGSSEADFIATSLKTRKRIYGIGLDYDYVLQSYSSLDFVIGLRASFQLYKYRTDLTNTHPLKNDYNNIETTFRNKETSNFFVTPNVGLRLNLNRFAIDAKFLLSMLSKSGDIDNATVRRVGRQPNMSTTTMEWTDEISNKFKLKPGVVMSMSYFF